MPIYKLQRYTASFHSSLQRYCSSEMKQEPLNTSTSVFDFDEEDPKPFVDLFKSSFNHNREQYGNLLKHGKSSGITSRKKRKISMKKLMENTSEGNVSVHEASGDGYSSASDMIEADDSDSELNQDRMQLDMRFGGARGVPCFNVCRDEDDVAETSRKVVVNGEVLLFLEQEYSNPEFIFSADAILLKIQVNEAECIVEWPLHEIESFRSHSDEGKGLAFIEFDLKDRGVETFCQELGQSASYYSCHTLYCSISNANSSWGKDIKQITSLSDHYKSIWRLGKVDTTERFRRDSCRQGLNNHENQHLSVNYIAQDRNRVSLEDWSDLIFPTKEDHDAVTVTRYDYLLLNPDQFLSDTIIDFYIKYLQSLLSEDENKRFYFYNSFFFRKLTEIDKSFQHGLEKSKSCFERVKRWTARLNIFDKDYLFIPIMQSAHWSLVIVCHPGYLSAGCQDACDSKVPMILHFDSLEGCHTCVEEPIRNYLVEAWNERNGHNDGSEGLSTLKFVAVKVPQQTNYSDCGLFLLHYVQLFIKEVLDKDSIDFLTDAWFNPADASAKRTEIQSLIQNLKVKESTGQLEKSQQHTHSVVLESPGGAWLAQRSVSFGDECHSAMIRVTNSVSSNLYDQACDMLVCHPQHHKDNMQGCTNTKLEHGHLELVLDHEHSAVAREPQQGFGNGLGQAPSGKLSMLSLQHGASNHVQDISMLDCICAKENCIVHGHDHVSLDDALDNANLSENLDVSHAQVEDVVKNSPYEFAEGLGNDPTMGEENFIVDVKSGFAFCVYYDDKRVSDITTSPVQNFNLEEIPSTHEFQNGSEPHNHFKHSTSDETDILAEDAVKSNSEHNNGIHGSSISDSEPKDWLFDSVSDDNDQLVGRESMFMDCKNVGTPPKADDRCQAMDLECMSIKGANRQLINEVGAANKSEGGRFLQNEDDSSELVIMEGSLSVSMELPTECKNTQTVSDSSSPPLKEERVGLDCPHYISSDEGRTPIAAQGIKEGKRGRGSCRRNTQHESKRILAPVNRRVTRSASKKQI
eukprot:c20519_g1_i3 orf=1024-4113(+)